MLTDEHNERIERVELKLMDLEDTVHQLNEVILAQYRDIERLQLQCEELLKQSSGTQPHSATPSATDELPPHY